MSTLQAKLLTSTNLPLLHMTTTAQFQSQAGQDNLESGVQTSLTSVFSILHALDALELKQPFILISIPSDEVYHGLDQSHEQHSC